MQRLSRTGYLSLRQAAQWLGMGNDDAATLRLKRRLMRLQARTSSEILHFDGRGYKVTKGTLREVLPEHFPRREVTLFELAKRFRGTMAALGRRKREMDKIAQQLREVTARVDAVEAIISDRKRSG